MQDERQRDRWVQVKEKIKSQWGTISDDELERTKGNISAISNIILQKYGESKQEVASKLVDVMHAVDSEEEIGQEPDGIIVDSRDPGSREWDSREDVNNRI